MCAWITKLQLGNDSRSHFRSSAICEQVNSLQTEQLSQTPLLWNQTPCFRRESIVSNKFIDILQSFDRRMLGKGSADT